MCGFVRTLRVDTKWLMVINRTIYEDKPKRKSRCTDDRKIIMRLCKYYRYGKAVIFSYSDCVFLALPN